MEVTIGGERLGSGNKNKAYLHNYERSTHDLSFVWRSTMAAGTLVPFMTEVALPGDTFDIDLDVDVLTHPTIGPLFGTYKVQLDVFQIPIRLYNAKLHMNMLGIGRDMSAIKLPKMIMEASSVDVTKSIDNQQINPSCILSYLGIRGLGQDFNTPSATVTRKFNAVPYIGYWDIYKNYYANKQEEKGAVIHKDTSVSAFTISSCDFKNSVPEISVAVTPPAAYLGTKCTSESTIVITIAGLNSKFDMSQIYFDTNLNGILTAYQVMKVWTQYTSASIIVGSSPTDLAKAGLEYGLVEYAGGAGVADLEGAPVVRQFDLKNIDDLRTQILQSTQDEFVLDGNSYEPLNLPLLKIGQAGQTDYPKKYSQQGLGLKTYNSDLFNNWISTEWIDGTDGISAITAIDTSTGSFTIDELNLSKKVYDMLNRIALSGGSYDDWLDAVYTHERTRSAENPMYLGGKIRNLVFQEVIASAASDNQPLGTLAGRGRIGSKDKGGKVVAKIDEPSYIMGIISITPNVDYSQGNKWDVNLESLNDFHKPALDQIGFQDLITDQMAWFDTRTDMSSGSPVNVYKSAGKQPAWINYMTNVNVVRGAFAEETQQMFMVLNRRYGTSRSGTGEMTIRDLTTYIDPSKFNHIFADTRRDAQNFWVQIGVGIEARRKMSAKVIPNL